MKKSVIKIEMSCGGSGCEYKKYIMPIGVKAPVVEMSCGNGQGTCGQVVYILPFAIKKAA